MFAFCKSYLVELLIVKSSLQCANETKTYSASNNSLTTDISLSRTVSEIVPLILFLNRIQNDNKKNLNFRYLVQCRRCMLYFPNYWLVPCLKTRSNRSCGDHKQWEISWKIFYFQNICRYRPNSVALPRDSCGGGAKAKIIKYGTAIGSREVSIR